MSDIFKLELLTFKSRDTSKTNIASEGSNLVRELRGGTILSNVYIKI